MPSAASRSRRSATRRPAPARPPLRDAPAGLGPLAVVHVGPGPDHLVGAPVGGAEQALAVLDPAVGPVLAAEAVLAGAAPRLEEAGGAGLRAREVVGGDALAPEAGALEVLARLVAEQALDVGADEGGRVVAAGAEAVEHGGRGVEQGGQALRRPGGGVALQFVAVHPAVTPWLWRARGAAA